MPAHRPRAALGPRERLSTLERLQSTRYDVVVVGGGVTGAGTALDAATRGLSVALVEMRDWAAGTSSRSGKLIHGGLRYLEQLNVRLVREALRERGLMLRTLCPHLTRPIPFVYPLTHRIWERPYVGAGLTLYDTIGGAGAVPRHRHASRAAVRRLAPGLRPDALVGAFIFYDVQMDDARHTVELVRTAADAGADVASAVKAVDLVKEAGAVTGVVAADLESGRTFTVRARRVVNATGAWADRLQDLTGGSPSYRVTASKGIHLLIPRDRIDSTVSMFVRAEDSVLFVRTWGRHWLVGTTDTAWTGDLDHPAATRTDVQYLLRNLNRVLTTPVTEEDVDGVFVGLRPLVGGRPGATSRLSREHAVETVVPGFTTVVGGKYTTYRVMARDVLDEATRGLPDVGPCRTHEVPLLGARGFEAGRATLTARATALGLADEQTAHLLGRYGSLTAELLDLVAADPGLATPIAGAEEYLRVEAVYAVTHEGALHLDDVMTRRTHVAVLTPDRGLAAVEEVAGLVAGPLGWDDARRADEVRRYRDRVTAERAAERAGSDPEAQAARSLVRDPRLEVADGLASTQG